MRVVYKYELKTEMELPIDWNILHIAEQYGKATVWIEIDPEEKETVVVHFKIFGTGRQFDTEEMHLSFIQTFTNGPFVWHVYIWHK